MISSNKKVVQILVRKLLENGVNHVVCSPGSRNSSIIIGLDEHPQMNCIVIHDERSAAFIALGMTQQLNAPVAMVCTSGSAMLNYYPAVAEAYYQRVPIVVISADRPEKWINQGDGQTIVQRGVYTNHIDAEIAVSEEDNLADVESKLDEALLKVSALSKGPIHINFAVDEPLYGTEEIPEVEIRQINSNPDPKGLSSNEKELIQEAQALPKKLFLFGQMNENEQLRNLLIETANDSSIAILVENTSNLVCQHWIHCIDRTLNLITEDKINDFVPDVLVTFGGAIVSKRIKAFIRGNKPKMHLKVGFDFPEMNTYECLTHSFEVKDTEFVSTWNELKPALPSSSFGSQWKQLDFLAQERSKVALASMPFSDLKVFELLLDFIPDSSHFHMGNSSVVRYCQLFDPIKGIKYWSNRGTSGIDGSSSTAVGAALANPTKMHTLITGDVSFFYDSNALWNNYSIPNLRIFLINNGGGGIFNIIAGPRESKQNSQYFEAKHKHSAEFICKAMNVEYCSAKNLETIENQMESFYKFDDSGGIKLMEIDTSAVENHLILDEFFTKIK